MLINESIDIKSFQ